MSFGYFRPYVRVANRKAKAESEVRAAAKRGKQLDPVRIEGNRIAATFWGKGWCEAMEQQHDYANRLPRGRSYVRNGSVIDLVIELLFAIALAR